MVSNSKALIKIINTGFTTVQLLIVTLLLFLLMANLLHAISITILLVILLPAIILFVYIARLKAKIITLINNSFAPMQALEQWADNNYDESAISPIKINTPVGNTIAKLQHQLLTQSNGNSSFDMLLREKALLDNDTGIGNREFFNSRLEALLKEEDSHGAVLFFHFTECETIQSLYGSSSALTLFNTLITTIKHRLNHLPVYFIARRNEFELALLIPDIYVKETEKLATRLVNNLMAVPLPVGISKEEFVHIGISFFKYATKPYQVMAEADMALRSAQLQGPSQWFMYDKGEVEHAKGSLKWRTLLSKVIAKNTLAIFFQPVIEQGTGQVLHQEVLTKIRDNERQLISARVFMPMVRKCGLTEQVDLLVFENVCQLVVDANMPSQYSLNLSVESLLSPDFLEKFKVVLAQHAGIAGKVIVEISEYHLVNNLTALIPVLSELTAKGITVIADKVGQFVVSSQYLKLCPISAIKLHRSIVLNIQEKPENQTVIQSLKAICAPLRISILALGVECEEEWEILLKLGVNGGQGHFFTKPMEQVVGPTH